MDDENEDYNYDESGDSGDSGGDDSSAGGNLGEDAGYDDPGVTDREAEPAPDDYEDGSGEEITADDEYDTERGETEENPTTSLGERPGYNTNDPKFQEILGRAIVQQSKKPSLDHYADPRYQQVGASSLGPLSRFASSFQNNRPREQGSNLTFGPRQIFNRRPMSNPRTNLQQFVVNPFLTDIRGRASSLRSLYDQGGKALKVNWADDTVMAASGASKLLKTGGQVVVIGVGAYLAVRVANVLLRRVA